MDQTGDPVNLLSLRRDSGSGKRHRAMRNRRQGLRILRGAHSDTLSLELCIHYDPWSMTSCADIVSSIFSTRQGYYAGGTETNCLSGALGQLRHRLWVLLRLWKPRRWSNRKHLSAIYRRIEGDARNQRGIYGAVCKMRKRESAHFDLFAKWGQNRDLDDFRVTVWFILIQSIFVSMHRIADSIVAFLDFLEKIRYNRAS